MSGFTLKLCPACSKRCAAAAVQAGADGTIALDFEPAPEAPLPTGDWLASQGARIRYTVCVWTPLVQGHGEGDTWEDAARAAMADFEARQ